MPTGDTIAAVATAPGRAARAMIRVSGPATREVLAAVLEEGPRPFDRGLRASRLSLGNGVGVAVLVATFRGPASYTGEDSAEIVLAGNPILAERVIARLGRLEGVRAAGPGEFTARAYLNDKLTLDRAEGIAATIAAESDEQLAAARDLLAGRKGVEYGRWAEELAMLLALVEAGIDFTDQEDVVPIAPRELSRRVRVLENELAAHLGAAAGAERASVLARVVLAGRPNAGKSTLFNALLGRRRAVVSPVAGTTRDVLEEKIDFGPYAPGAGPLTLVDLAGLDGVLTGAVDLEAQARARAEVARADVVVWCDPSGRFEPDALRAGGAVIRVRTKADLPWSGRAEAIPVCALDGHNLGTLRRAIADQACSSRAAGLSALLPRHRRAIAAAMEELRRVGAACEEEGSSFSNPEVIAAGLRAGLDQVGELVGRISPDDVIGRVFATFCVGK